MSRKGTTMTRKCDGRDATPPPGPEGRSAQRPKSARSAPAHKFGRGCDGAPERRDSHVARIYGFHSVEAALKAPRRELIRLYATVAAADRLRQEIDARGVETRILTPDEVA